MNNESNNRKSDLFFNFEVLFLVKSYLRQVMRFSIEKSHIIL